MPEFKRKRLRHDVPDWIDPTQEAFFITINCLPRGENQLAKPEIWNRIIDSIQFREQRGEWKWKLILAMPDHVHGIVTFPNNYSLKNSISAWKRWHASHNAIQWQDGFFDHRLRTQESAIEKAKYIRMNPARAGLIDQTSEWNYIRDWK